MGYNLFDLLTQTLVKPKKQMIEKFNPIWWFKASRKLHVVWLKFQTKMARHDSD